MPKRLVLCADGTWNHPEQHRGETETPTNVVRIARALAPEDERGVQQVVWYQWGLGTRSRLNRFLGGIFGAGLEANVESAYRFLAQNYLEGDEIYLLGFSRGAFIVRSVAGMMHNVGLLRPDAVDRVDEAYDRYRSHRRRHHPDAPSSRAFRERYARDATVHFLGVWDTIGARGIPLTLFNAWNRWRHGFHDVRLNPGVENAFQALAIDERRGPYTPAIWEPPKRGLDAGQRLEQAWFAGVHADVGGGYLDAGLSDVALVWMADRARECGLAFDERKLEMLAAPDPLGTLHESVRGYHRLLHKRVRELGRVDPGSERVHPSALGRLADPRTGYRPANLLRYLGRAGRLEEAAPIT
jgi:uncharacterized protein (DUF2235 family)